MGCFDCLERTFFRLFPTKKKETENPNGEWLRCVMAIATFLHFGMALFCMALVGFPAMILNFIQSIWSYSVYLTLREREMILYIVALLAQFANSFCFLFRGEEKPTGAFQTGGTIADIVFCGIMLIVGGRALWKFHETGGLHYKFPEKDINEPLINDEAGDADDDDDEEEKKQDAKAGKKEGAAIKSPAKKTPATK